MKHDNQRAGRRGAWLTFFLCGVGLSWLVAGCRTSKDYQLEHIAKDWCMTIRASQVIPVYPLTEDVQPGDVFLVQTPIDRQQAVYKDKGFLPLDNHVARLNPNGYSNFYSQSFLARTNSMLPCDWIRPGAATAHAWDLAPHAAFPTYSFSVRKGGGLNLAVPIQGVPVGLSLLGSDAAYGSVTIKKAATLGVDMASLYRDLTAWARTNTTLLEHFEPAAKETNYLRVLTRVYATGEMDVELRDASSRSGGLDVGAAKPVNLLFPQLASGKSNVAETVVTNYLTGWSVLSNLLNAATSASGNFAPGGSLRLVAASARTICLQETFTPPLLIGYLGFDCPILAGGRLGSPIPTYAHLDPKTKIHSARVKQFNTDLKDQIASYDIIAKRYSNAPPALQEKIRGLARDLKLSADGAGADWIEAFGAIVDGNDPVKAGRFRTLADQVKDLN